MSIVVTGANRHDVTQIEAVLKNRVRKPRGRTKQNLCADAGYSGKKSKEIMQVYRYEPHIRPRGEEKIAVTDSKHVAGLWRLSTPGSIDSGNCLSDMKRQIGHMNHCFNWRPVLSFLEN